MRDRNETSIEEMARHFDIEDVPREVHGILERGGFDLPLEDPAVIEMFAMLRKSMREAYDGKRISAVWQGTDDALREEATA